MSQGLLSSSSRRAALLLFAGLLSLSIGGLVGCGGAPEVPGSKPTFPVTGEVFLDGSPAAGVTVTLHDLSASDLQSSAGSMGITDADGKFKISTFTVNDGAPAGEYALSFKRLERGMVTSSEGKDEFKGKYASPAKSTFKIKVEDKPLDAGKFELTTK